MLEFLGAIFHEKEAKAEIAVRDSRGRIRRVEITVHAKDGMAIPENWPEIVRMEIDLQDEIERNPLVTFGSGE